MNCLQVHQRSYASNLSQKGKLLLIFLSLFTITIDGFSQTCPLVSLSITPGPCMDRDTDTPTDDFASTQFTIGHDRSPLGEFQLFDPNNQPLGTFGYDQGVTTTITLDIPMTGQQVTYTVQEVGLPSCQVSQTIQTQSCSGSGGGGGGGGGGDACPNDPNKTEPGACGCGTPDTDSDNDGTPDCQDECPNNAGVTVEGPCGCESTLGGGDSDGDGTIDCEDGCPFDGNKTEPGACGCGEDDSQDRDGDGVPDCIDTCPDEANATFSEKCGCNAPEIIDLRMVNPTSCQVVNINGAGEREVFFADVQITFAEPPTQGAISLQGAGRGYLPISIFNRKQTLTISNVRFKADGNKVILTAAFAGNETCQLTKNIGTAPEPCALEKCDLPNLRFTEDDFSINVTWDVIEDVRLYEVSYLNGNGDGPWTTETTTSTSIQFARSNIGTLFRVRVRSLCQTRDWSNYSLLVFTNKNLPTTCAMQAGNYTVQEVDINQLSNELTFRMKVVGPTGKQYLVNNATPQVGNYNEWATFQMQLDLSPIIPEALSTLRQFAITLTDVENQDCEITHTIDFSAAYSELTIENVTLTNIRRCRDRGTIFREDDLFTADVTFDVVGVIPRRTTYRILGDRGRAGHLFEKTISEKGFVIRLDKNGTAVFSIILSNIRSEGNFYLEKVIAIPFKNTPCSSAGKCELDLTFDVVQEGATVRFSAPSADPQTLYRVEYQFGRQPFRSVIASGNNLAITGLFPDEEYTYRISKFCQDLDKWSNFQEGTFNTPPEMNMLCLFQSKAVSNIRCFRNNTPEDYTDDYFQFDLLVEGIGETYEVNANFIDGNSTGRYGIPQTFTTVLGDYRRFNNQRIIIQNPQDPSCVTTIPIPVDPLCFTRTRISHHIIDIKTCLNRNSNSNYDDLIRADITVFFNTGLTEGNLILETPNRQTYTVPVARIRGQSSHTFKNIPLRHSALPNPIFIYRFSAAPNFSRIFSADIIRNGSTFSPCDPTCTNLFFNRLVSNVVCERVSQLPDRYIFRFDLLAQAHDRDTTDLYEVSFLDRTNYPRVSVPFNTVTRLSTPSFTSPPESINIALSVETNRGECTKTIRKSVANKCVSGNSNRISTVTLPNTTAAHLKIYPNPVMQELTIEQPEQSFTNHPIQVSIVNLMGQVELEQTIDHTQSVRAIDVQHLENGIYFLIWQQGSRRVTKRFVKEDWK